MLNKVTLNVLCLFLCLLFPSIVFSESEERVYYLPFVAGKFFDENYYIYQNQNKKPTAQVSSCSKFGVGSKSSPGKNGNTQSSCWITGKWEGCSVTCGEGESIRPVVCVDIEGNPSNDCDESVRPPTNKNCVSYSNCNYSWKIEDWGSCQAGCGESSATRSVTCVDAANNVVEDILCSATSAKPATENTCTSYDSCTYEAEYGEWSACSSQCVAGTQTRTAECMRSDGTVVDIDLCSNVENTQDCTGTDVCTFDWEYSEWGVCSNTCGDGTQSRTAVCKASDESLVNNSFCEESPYLSKDCIDNSGCITLNLRHESHFGSKIYLSDSTGSNRTFLTNSFMDGRDPVATTFMRSDNSPVYVVYELTSMVPDGDSAIWGYVYKSGASSTYTPEVVSVSDPRVRCNTTTYEWAGLSINSMQCLSFGHWFTVLLKFNPN